MRQPATILIVRWTRSPEPAQPADLWTFLENSAGDHSEPQTPTEGRRAIGSSEVESKLSMREGQIGTTRSPFDMAHRLTTVVRLGIAPHPANSDVVVTYLKSSSSSAAAVLARTRTVVDMYLLRSDK